jgi:hypothetical protein
MGQAIGAGWCLRSVGVIREAEEDYEPKRYIKMRTNVEQRAPMLRPYLNTSD